MMGVPFDVCWIHGSADCATNEDPALQVHQFDDDTYVLRQNKCQNYEAPFLYLLFGSQRALLLDTGAEPFPGELPLAAVVDEIIAGRSTRGSCSVSELVVGHSHAHGDHTYGDDQFASRANITVVAPTRLGVQKYFGINDWPGQSVSFELGDRALTVIPVPGHDDAHIAVYDAKCEFLLTGDTLYPGFLYVRNWAEYRRSIQRLVRLADDVSIQYVLGAHIEMTRTPGVAYPPGTTHQPEEHVLELELRHLLELHRTLQRLGDVPTQTVLNDFIIEPIGA